MNTNLILLNTPNNQQFYSHQLPPNQSNNNISSHSNQTICSVVKNSANVQLIGIYIFKKKFM
jgi:hypothetical protein